MQKYEEMVQGKKEDDYGEENEDDEKEKQPLEKPVMPVFDLEEHMRQWEEQNTVVEIPEEIIDDVDNDWILEQEEVDALVKEYLANKE